jgi:voltage-gated potassium channel Kch
MFCSSVNGKNTPLRKRADPSPLSPNALQGHLGDGDVYGNDGGGALPGQIATSGSGDSQGDDPSTPLVKVTGGGKLDLGDTERDDVHASSSKLSSVPVDVHEAVTRAVHQHAHFKERGPLVINPRAWYMRNWDVVTMLLLFYTAVVTPVEVAFMSTKLNILFFINRGVDTCFLVDIVLTFFVAIPDPSDGLLLFHHPTIIRSYLRGWFVLDVVSILPFDLVSIIFNNGAVSKLKILRVLRLLKLMKLLRIFRAARIFQRLETQYTIDYSALELVKFGILALTCSHWMACAWGLLADLEDAKHNWLKYTTFNSFTENGLLEEGQDPRGVVPPLEIYVAALYWSAMTMSTIGYGDILPSTLAERVFVSVAMLFGAFIYGYIIGAVSNVISTRNQRTNKFYQLMSELNAFLKEGKFKHDLRIRLREYFKYCLSGADVSTHTALLKQMSPALRGEITLSMNTWITKVEFFKQCPEALVIQLTMNINQQTYPPQEKILVPGDWCNKMYMVRKGIAICRQKILVTGNVFCVECLYKEGKVAYSAHAVTFVDLYYFDRTLLLESLYYFPDMKRHFQLLSLKRVFHDEVCAYAKAYTALLSKGAEADLTDFMDERPSHFLKKLRILNGHDGAGLRAEGDGENRAKEQAATIIQRRFRGYTARLLVRAKVAEEGCTGVFDKHIRKMDPNMYVARAIDVFHHRTGVSLHLLHQKVDSLLSGEPLPSGAGTTGAKSAPFTFSTPMPRQVSDWREFGGRTGGDAAPASGNRAVFPPGPFPDTSEAASAHHAATAAEAAAASASRGIEDLRHELRLGFASVMEGGRSGGDDGHGGGGGRDSAPSSSASARDDAVSALDRRLSRGIAAQEARAAHLELLVSDMCAQVGAVSRTLSQMSEVQRMFQERSQRTLLANLEQAQARMRDQVAKAVGGAAGGMWAASDELGLDSSASRPGPGRGSHSRPLSLTESDPPPSRAGAQAGAGYGAGASNAGSGTWTPGSGSGMGAPGSGYGLGAPGWESGLGTLARRPLSANAPPPPPPPLRSNQGFQ